MPMRAAQPVHRRYAPLVAGATVWLVLAWLAALLLDKIEDAGRLEARDHAREALSESREQIDRRLSTALAVPETLAAVISAYGRLDAVSFDAIASRLVRSNRTIRSVAVAPGNVVALVHPLRGNTAAIGLNYSRNPEQYPAVLQAMRTRQTVIAGPIRLVQGGVGLASRTPVFLDGPRGVDTRYWGLVSVTVDIGELFSDIGRIAERNDLSIAVRRADASGQSGVIVSGDEALFGQSPVSLYFPIPGGGRLQLAAIPEDGWTSGGVPAWWPWLLQGLALLTGLGTWRLLEGRERYRLMASRDALTGLLNRKTFDHRLSEAMLDIHKFSHGLILMDLDGFKPINDTHGHSAGDQVLKQVAIRLHQYAVANGATAYRLGGDEFALLLSGVRALEDVRQMALQVTALVSQPVLLEEERSVAAGASAGATVFPADGHAERAGDVFDRADRALYRSKAVGGGVHVEPPTEAIAPGA